VFTQSSPFAANIVDHAVVILLILMHLATLALIRIRRGSRNAGWMRWVAMLLTALCGTTVAGCWLLQGRPLAWMGLATPASTTQWGFVAAAVLWICIMVWVVRSEVSACTECEACRAQVLDGMVGPGRKGPSGSGAIFIALAALEEELVFRGFLLRYIAAIASGLASPTVATIIAIVFSALAFGVAHITNAARGSVLFASLAGLIFGVLTAVSDSLWPALIAHTGHNAAVGWMGWRLSFLPPPTPGARHIDDARCLP